MTNSNANYLPPPIEKDEDDKMGDGSDHSIGNTFGYLNEYLVGSYVDGCKHVMSSASV